MPSWGTLIRREMAMPGLAGSNARRIAEGVTAVDGDAVAALGTRGSWWRRIADGAGITTGRGGWAARLGGLRAMSEDSLLTAGASAPEGETYVTSGASYVKDGAAFVTTEIA